MTTTVRLTRIVIVAAGLLFLGLCGCDRGTRPTPAQDGLNVILISMDTTRADHLGCYGYSRIQTPNIDRLAREGTLFTQCTSAAPITLPSHASILTGSYPFIHGVRDNVGYQLQSDNRTLAEELSDAGYGTAAQVGAFVLNHEFGLDQGFDSYRDVDFAGKGEKPQTAEAELGAEEVTDGAIRLLRAIADRRFFLFVHYYDPHHPYEAPQRFARQYESPYDAEIAYTDEQIGRLLEEVSERGVDDRTLIVLTSDHGEGLGQHRESTHAYFVYDTTLTVPLIFWCPRRVPAGRKLTAQVRTIDIAPTILSLLELPSRLTAQGADLSPMLLSGAHNLRLTAYAESFYGSNNLGFSQLRALRDGRWKYVHATPPELYDVGHDPLEQGNLATVEPERVAEMRAALRDLLERSPQVGDSQHARRAVEAGELARLQSLGYVGGEPTSVPVGPEGELSLFEPTGRNPMKHAREIEMLTRALGLMRTGQHQKAELVLRALLAEGEERSVGFVKVHAQLASVLSVQGKLPEALQHLRQAVQARPDDGRFHAMIGVILRTLGRYNEAITEFQRALALEPVLTDTYLDFARTLIAVGRSDDAIEQYRLAIDKDPARLDARIGLATLQADCGELATARETIERAIEVARAANDANGLRELRDLRHRCE
jgi:choline-sulfatase